MNSYVALFYNYFLTGKPVLQGDAVVPVTLNCDNVIAPIKLFLAENIIVPIELLIPGNIIVPVELCPAED